MTDTQNSAVEDEDNIFKIMIASDIHLGYNEKDVIRGQDSFDAFEEVLQHARANKVDFILLGGDLFHDANPSINTLNQCVKLLKNYTLGDDPITFEFLSSQRDNFKESLTETVNYEDPNMNIALPVFSIHGNHDDPAGFNRMSSLDILSTTGLINYFGRWTDLTKIELSPIMLQKGTSKLSIYGLSYIHDPRLVRLFHDSKVTMKMPENAESDMFNIMVVHQNRADRGPKNYLPEEVLPEFLDLIVWGHEHDCEIELNMRPRGFFICQPGSSVATSLSHGESLEKHCGMLLVKGKECKMVPIKLETVRPFVFRTIALSNYNLLDEGDVQGKVMDICEEEIKKMVEEAKKQSTNGKLPLLRLRVEPTNETQMFNPVRFGQKYSKVCANPLELILFSKISRKGIKKQERDTLDRDGLHEAFENRDVNKANVEEIVDRYFEELKNDDGAKEKQLEIFSSRSLSEMTRRLVQNDDDDAADKIIEFYRASACKYLDENSAMGSTEEILENYRAQEDINYDSMLKMLDNRKTDLSQKRTAIVATTRVTDSDEDDGSTDSSNTRTTNGNSMFLKPPSEAARPKTGRGSRGGRTTAASRSSTSKANTSPAANTSSTANTSTTGRGRNTRKNPLF